MCLNMLRYYGHSLIPLLSLAFTYETHPHSHPHPPELTHTLPLNDSSPIQNSSWPVLSEKKLCPPFILYYATELHPWAQKRGLSALGSVSAGCHGLMKAVWPHDQAAVISLYLCICGASSLYACLHGCGYSSLWCFEIFLWVGGGGCECMCAYFCIFELCVRACEWINQRVFEPTGSSLCDVQEKLYATGWEWKIWRLLRRFSIWDCQTCWN